MTKVNKRQQIIFGGLSIIWNYNCTSVSQRPECIPFPRIQTFSKNYPEAFNVKKKKKKNGWLVELHLSKHIPHLICPSLETDMIAFLVVWPVIPWLSHYLPLHILRFLLKGHFLRKLYSGYSIKNKNKHGFPGGPIVKNSPCNAGDMGSVPCAGKSRMLQGN